jgi:proline dehydrogenase
VKAIATEYGMRPGGFARRFIAGDTLGDAIETAQRLEDSGHLCTLNYLGESVASAEDARGAASAYEDVLREVRAAGLSCQVSVKLTQLGLAVDAESCEQNLRRVLNAAGEQNFVRIDMEQSIWVDPTLTIFERACRKGYRNVGVVLQSYLYRTSADLARLEKLKAKIRLCKGAYRESASVAYPRKSDVDAAFLRLMRTLIDEGSYPAFATHDPRMIAATKTYAAERGLGADGFEFQMLYGVRRDLQAALRAEGYRVRVYLPFGQQWFPYFMRRLGERPANVMFVVRSFWHDRSR